MKKSTDLSENRLKMTVGTSKYTARSSGLAHTQEICQNSIFHHDCKQITLIAVTVKALYSTVTLAKQPLLLHIPSQRKLESDPQLEALFVGISCVSAWRVCPKRYTSKAARCQSQSHLLLLQIRATLICTRETAGSETKIDHQSRTYSKA